jgi:hypothetical protein
MAKIMRLREDRASLRIAQKELITHLDDIFSILNQVQDRLNMKIEALPPMPQF